MLAKMGWKKGNGLGKNQSGSTDFIQVRYKNNEYGLGFNGLKDDQWTQNEMQFDNLLKSLNEQTSEEQKVAEKKSLVEKSESSRARVHYKKRIQSKDVHRYSAKDLANIFGKKTLEEVEKSPEDEKEEEETIEIHEFDSDLIKNTGISSHDYFKSKLAKHKKIIEDDTDDVQIVPIQTEETEVTEVVETKKKKKKSKKDEDIIELASQSTEEVQEVVPNEIQNVEKKRKKKKSKINETNEDQSQIQETPNGKEIEVETDKMKSKKKKKRKAGGEVIDISSSGNDSSSVEEVQEIMSSENEVEEVVEKKQKRKSNSVEFVKEVKPQDKKIPENVKSKEDAATSISPNVVQITANTASKMANIKIEEFNNSNISNIIGYGMSENIEIKVLKTKFGDIDPLKIDKYALYNTGKVMKKRINPRKVLSSIKKIKKRIQVIS